MHLMGLTDSHTFKNTLDQWPLCGNALNTLSYIFFYSTVSRYSAVDNGIAINLSEYQDVLSEKGKHVPRWNYESYTVSLRVWLAQ